MTKRLTAEQLEAIRQRAEKASSTFWGTQTVELIPHGYQEITVRADINEICEVDTIQNPNAKNDADFIANARQDIPALLAEVEQLRIKNEKYRQALSQIAHGDTWTAYPHDIAAWALGLEMGGGDSE